jgi:hypothetical protein
MTADLPTARRPGSLATIEISKDYLNLRRHSQPL